MKYVTIIGGGRIGTMFAQLRNVDGYTVSILRRGEQSLLGEGPIVVCTRNNDLEDVLEWIPSARYSDLIFVQNGMLFSWFEEQGLNDVTTALLYVAVSSVGDEPVDGGRTVVTGPLATTLQTMMYDLGLECQTITFSTFTVEMVEKFLWNCVFGLLCQVHSCPVGALVKHQKEEIDGLTLELLSICEIKLGFAMQEVDKHMLIDRLCDYSLSIPNYQGAVKEWPWRNGWLIESNLPQPLHIDYLQKVVPNLL